jgi:N-acetylglucosaminyl-diphospho-decaprenol L-rhamnosyltransferase
MDVSIHIVIVTHNSSEVLSCCLEHLARQNVNLASLVIVDSGSSDISYIEDLNKRAEFKLILADNIGFARANNLGFKEIGPQSGVVLFLNPDTFLPENYIFQAVEILTDNGDAAIVSGKLLGYNVKEGKKNGRIDSTGIFRKWYGRWFDRGKGENDSEKYNHTELLPAVCGALMVCRIEALKQYGGEVFDSDFFLYKEDIELSLRLRRDGWKLLYDPRLVACHCRGWEDKRKNIPFALRKIAAKNEVLLYRKHPSPYIIWAFMKYILVSVFHI